MCTGPGRITRTRRAATTIRVAPASVPVARAARRVATTVLPAARRSCGPPPARRPVLPDAGYASAPHERDLRHQRHKRDALLPRARAGRRRRRSSSRSSAADARTSPICVRGGGRALGAAPAAARARAAHGARHGARVPGAGGARRHRCAGGAADRALRGRRRQRHALLRHGVSPRHRADASSCRTAMPTARRAARASAWR